MMILNNRDEFSFFFLFFFFFFCFLLSCHLCKIACCFWSWRRKE